MSTKMLKSIHRRILGITKDDFILAKRGYAAGGERKPTIMLPGSPDTVAIWDDFIGDTGRDLSSNTDPYWRLINGDTGAHDTGTNQASVDVKPGTSGIVRITNGTNPKPDARLGLTGSLCWKGNQGSGPTTAKNGLRMGARVKMHGFHDTGNSDVNVWIGFTDTTASEVPVMDTGGAVVSTATNAFGIAFNSRAAGGDTGWVGYAVNGGTDRTPVVLDTGVKDNVYDVVEMELHHGPSDTGGTVTFYVNGEPKGSIASPVAMNVALAPQILVWGDTGGGQQVDVDWINVSAPRDTGL